MTSSAPIDRTRSACVVVQTPVTWAPKALAICTANDPTPPAAPMQNVLAGLNPPLVAESLERGGPGNGDRRRLLEGEVGRLGCERALSSGRVLGEGPVAGAEHLVARREARYVLADRLDDAGDVLGPG